MSKTFGQNRPKPPKPTKPHEPVVSAALPWVHPPNVYKQAFLQLTFRDDDDNDYIGPFECYALAVAHAMVYGPPVCRLYLPEGDPKDVKFARCIPPGDHRKLVYAQQQAAAKAGGPAEPEVFGA